MSRSDLGRAFADAYRTLEPGQAIAVAVACHPGADDRRSSRDVLGTALFRAGFRRARFEVLGNRLIARAIRGPDLPPEERVHRLSVVMPVYNESQTVTKVLDELLEKEILGIEFEFVIVESNSTDGTREIVSSYTADPRVKLVLEERPQGKGHAVRTGLRAATGDYVLIQDADLEYDLDDYERLLEPLRRFEASFVLGERARTHGARFGVRHFEKERITGYLMNAGNHFFLRLFNAVYRASLHDPFTMYKVFRRDCLEGLHLECNRFDFDWEFVGKMVRLGYRPTEITVSYHSRPFAEGKKIHIVRDPFTWIVACFKYRFARLES